MDPCEQLSRSLSSFATSIPLWAERRDDGSIEIIGLGQPVDVADDRCYELIGALEGVDPTLDPDDLLDAIAVAASGDLQR